MPTVVFPEPDSPTMPSVVSKQGPSGAQAVSTRAHVHQIFALTQGQRPLNRYYADWTGRPATEALERSLHSRRFAEVVLSEFLRGSDRPDRHQTFQLTGEIVAREAQRWRGAATLPPIESKAEATDLLSWRQAFFQFWLDIGDAGDTLLRDVAKRSDQGRSNATAFAEAIAAIREIDRLNTAQDYVEAFLAARSGVERGLTCFTARYLAIGYRLCAEPARLERMLHEHGAVCSARFVDALREGMAQLLETPPGETGPEVRLTGELPKSYWVLNDPGPARFSATAGTIWDALVRRGSVVAPPPPVPPRLVMATTGAPAEEVALIARELASQGVRVTLIDPPGGQVRPLFAPHEPVNFATDLAEARRGLTGGPEPSGPLLVLASFAPVPRQLFDILVRTGSESEVLPVTIEFPPGTSTPGLDAIAGRESALSGIFAHSAPAAWLKLDAAEDRPDLAGETVAATGVTPAGLFLPRKPSHDVAEFQQAFIVVSFRTRGPAGEGSGLHVSLEATTTGTAAAQALQKASSQPGVAEDTPVVFLADGLIYGADYVGKMTHRYEIHARRLPIAVRGLEIRRGDGACELADSRRDNGLHRSGLLGMCCLGLRDAIDALQTWGPRPATRCVAFFAPAAAAWDDGSNLVHGQWAELLRYLQGDVGISQRIFEAAQANLFAGIACLERTSDGPPPVPFQTYLRGQEAVRRHMADALRVDDPAVPLGFLLGNLATSSLISDGDGESVRRFLEALASRLPDLISLPVGQFRDLLDLVMQCGVQEAYAVALAPLAPALCASDPQKIFPTFRILSNVLGDTVVVAALFAALEKELARTKRQRRSISRLATLASQLCPESMLPFVLRLLDAEVGVELVDYPEVIRAFGMRLLVGGEIDFELRYSGLTTRSFFAALSARDRLYLALVSRDRDGLIETMREMVDRHQLLGLLEVLREMSSEACGLGITSGDWPYPAYAGPQETLAIAAILGDTEIVATELEKCGCPSTRAVAGYALGSSSGLDALYAGWAAAEGIAPVSFRGGSISELYEGLAAEGLRAMLRAEGDAPRVSTIITTFDADPEWLRLALTSILQQSWPNFEVLLVDDGSAGSFSDAARALAGTDPRITFLELPRNMGPYVARNFALAHASGEFVAIQDADDYSHPDRFARQAAVLQADPAVLATASNHIRFDERGRPQFQKGLQVVADGTMTTMFRRVVFDRLGPFAETRSRGDVEYRERIRQAYGPAAFRETFCPLVFCYGAPTTLSQSVAREKAHALKEFRHGFSERRWRWTPDGPAPLGRLSVPAALRP